MVKTIGNPLSWIAHVVTETGHTAETVTGNLGSRASGPPKVNTIGLDAIGHALRLGLDDFAAFRVSAESSLLPITTGSYLPELVGGEIAVAEKDEHGPRELGEPLGHSRR